MRGTRLTTEEFIKKAKNLHGDKFNYDKVNYKILRKKIEIYCNKCQNYFWQLAYVHLNTKGYCPVCNLRAKTKTTEKFIEECILKHNGEYDYSKTKYIRNSDKVCIIHKKCGREIFQAAYEHLRGRGCNYCYGILRLDKEVFLEKASKIYGDEYDYSQFNYINGTVKGTLIHKKCGGSFQRCPNKHLENKGCAYCTPVKFCVRGRYFSTKNNIDFKYDSLWEKRRMEYYDNNPHIVSWGRCKDKILYFDPRKNKMRIYYPDFEIVYNDGEIFVEEIKCLIQPFILNIFAKFEAAKWYYLLSAKKYYMIKKDKYNNFLDVTMKDFNEFTEINEFK